MGSSPGPAHKHRSNTDDAQQNNGERPDTVIQGGNRTALQRREHTMWSHLS